MSNAMCEALAPSTDGRQFQTDGLAVVGEIGPWRTPKSLADAKQIADTMIDYIDSEFLSNFGLDLLGVPQATELVINHWKQLRRNGTCTSTFPISFSF